MKDVKMWGAIFFALMLFGFGFMVSLILLSGCVEHFQEAGIISVVTPQESLEK